MVVPTVGIKARLLAVALVANLFVAAFLAPSAHACSCASVSPERQIKTSDAVFSGEVMETEEGGLVSPSDTGPPLGPVTLDVKDAWKGASENSIVVYGYGLEASCGIEFERGESYLVYAHRSNGEASKPLETSLCEGTKPMSDAGADLRVLGSPTTELPDTGGRAFQPGNGASFSVAVVAIIVAAGVLGLRWRVRGPR
jgi:hypothetical protein